MHQRITKILMVFSLSVFAFLVTFNNITDYHSNFNFVQHVLSMDSSSPNNALMYRSITSPTLWHTGYWLVIAGEGLTFLLFLIGGIRMLKAINGSAKAFEASKKLAIYGAALGFMVWFFGFMIVGGPWFAMWQSVDWSGQEAAFKFYIVFLGVLTFVNQPSQELD